jgi:hypothetical protein
MYGRRYCHGEDEAQSQYDQPADQESARDYVDAM